MYLCMCSINLWGVSQNLNIANSEFNTLCKKNDNIHSLLLFFFFVECIKIELNLYSGKLDSSFYCFYLPLCLVIVMVATTRLMLSLLTKARKSNTHESVGDLS